jgi:hypothetical protein
MSLELWNTIGTLGTFIVITATAVAAIIQLRHLRQSNQLSGLLSVLDLMQQPRVHELFDYIRHDLPTLMEDPVFRAGLDKKPADRREHPELHLCDLYEQIGSYVRAGLIDEELLIRPQFQNIIMNWEVLEPAIMIIRRKRPAALANFEYLAMRARAWYDRFPKGDYPKGVARSSGTDIWLVRDMAQLSPTDGA